MSALVRFLVAGTISAGASWLIRFPLSLVLPFPIAVAAATALGMTIGFILYRNYVFVSERPLLLAARDFVGVNLIGAGVAVLISVASERILLMLNMPRELAEPIAHALGIAAAAFFNYFGHKQFTFRSGQPIQSTSESA